MADKPEVTFQSVIGWIDSASGGIRAHLSGVTGHPSSLTGNDPWARTSLVERIVYDDGGRPVEIETRHSVYRRAA